MLHLSGIKQSLLNLHIRIPFAIDKDLGRAYNEAMRDIPDGDWCCLIDYDVCFLLPSTIRHIIEYVKRNDGAGLLTCWTGRIGNEQQLFDNGEDITDMGYHTRRAQGLEQNLYKTTDLSKDISGFLMVVSKSTWNDLKFPEGGKCLGVDSAYSQSILSAGKQIVRMDGIYVWHSYRLLNGIKDKSHLL